MKRSFLICLFALFSVGVSSAQNTIEVVVNGMRKTTGKILVSLHNSQNTYGSYTTCYKSKDIDVSKHENSCVFNNLADGTYTVTLYHDDDNNRKLTTNFLGIPREGFGFSNNAKVVLGRPAYKLAKFDVKGNRTVRQIINLQFL
ncbi:MAG: DUF2141 domain-containing protein [Mucinivorans sp.]